MLDCLYGWLMWVGPAIVGSIILNGTVSGSWTEAMGQTGKQGSSMASASRLLPRLSSKMDGCSLDMNLNRPFPSLNWFWSWCLSQQQEASQETWLSLVILKSAQKPIQPGFGSAEGEAMSFWTFPLSVLSWTWRSSGRLCAPTEHHWSLGL